MRFKYIQWECFNKWWKFFVCFKTKCCIRFWGKNFTKVNVANNHQSCKRQKFKQKTFVSVGGGHANLIGWVVLGGRPKMTCLGSKTVKHGYQFCKTSRFLVVFWILNFKYCLKTDQTIFPLCQMPYNTRNIKKINSKWPKIPKVSPPTHTPITIKRRSIIFL